MHLIIYLCFTVIVLFLLLYFARLLAGRYSALHAYNRGAKSDFSVCIVLGSGGHTTEILRIVSNLGPRYSKRHYILADTDTTSLCKMQECEKMRRNSNENEVEFYDFHFIPRSREVGQSYFSSIFTTLWSLYKILRIVFVSDYDLLLCNGPGTCVPVKLDSNANFKNAYMDPYKLWPPLLLNNVDKDQVIYDSYDWRDYLDKNKFSAAPVQAFYHSPLRSAWKRIGPGLKVEVPNRDYWERAEPIGGAYWIATIIKIHGYKALLRYDGFNDDASNDFYMNLCSSDIHPVGWCAKEGKPLVAPKTLTDRSTPSAAQSVADWKAFLVKKLTGAKTLPSDFHQKIRSLLASKLKVGQIVEAIDRNDMRRYRPGVIKEIHGQRLKIEYLPVSKELMDAVKKLSPNDVLPAVHKTLWCHAKSPFVKHVGWCAENNVSLYCNPDYLKSCKDKIRDRMYDVNDTLEEHFPRTPTPTPPQYPESADNYEHLIYREIQNKAKFVIDMKLEAIDVYNVFNTIAAATVSRLYENGLMEITYDGSEEGLVVDDKSPFIFPVAFCQSQSIVMAKPENYNFTVAKKVGEHQAKSNNNEAPFNWCDYLRETNSEGASFVYFKKPEVENLFRVGQKIEATDNVDPHIVCVATIAEVKDRLIRVHYDGWASNFDQWFDITSPEIYPVGYCEMTGHFLDGPRLDDATAAAADLVRSPTTGVETFKNNNRRAQRPSLSFNRRSLVLKSKK